MTDSAPPEGWGRPYDVIAANVRSLRALRRLSQADLAARLTYLGHAWAQSTVVRVEAGKRPVSVAELFSLALALAVSPSRLLDLERAELHGLVLAEGAALRTEDARAWLTGSTDAVRVYWQGNDIVTVDTNPGEAHS